jgi:hypothetical protein
MKIRFRIKAIIAIVLFLGFGTYARTYSRTNNRLEKETTMTNHAKGTFEVKMTPLEDKTLEAGIGRMNDDKQLHGDIEGTGKSQMLYAYGDKKESGAYVAIEKISGTLNGRKGTFILYHAGSMTAAGQEMNIYVVPDSGTDELTGISGKFNIIITDGKHSYDFEYTLPAAQ